MRVLFSYASLTQVSFSFTQEGAAIHKPGAEMHNNKTGVGQNYYVGQNRWSASPHTAPV